MAIGRKLINPMDLAVLPEQISQGSPESSLKAASKYNDTNAITGKNIRFDKDRDVPSSIGPTSPEYLHTAKMGGVSTQHVDKPILMTKPSDKKLSDFDVSSRNQGKNLEPLSLSKDLVDVTHAYKTKQS